MSEAEWCRSSGHLLLDGKFIFGLRSFLLASIYRMRCIRTWYVFSSVHFYDYDYVVSHYRQFSWVCNCGHGRYCPFSKMCSLRSHRFVCVTCMSVTHPYNIIKPGTHSFVPFVRIVHRCRIKMRCEWRCRFNWPCSCSYTNWPGYVGSRSMHMAISVQPFRIIHFGIGWHTKHNAQALLFIVLLRSHTHRSCPGKIEHSATQWSLYGRRCIQCETFKSDLYCCSEKATSFGCKFYGRITINVRFELLSFRIWVLSFIPFSFSIRSEAYALTMTLWSW